MLQIRSVEFASKYQVPIRVLSSFAPDEGTLITREDPTKRDEAITTIIANADYDVPDLAGRAPDDIDDIRAVVEDALGRAGWSADVSLLDDAQVIALFTEIARQGALSGDRIEAITEKDG